MLPADKVQVYLLFYKPTPTDPLQNRIVSYFDKPFCHVEMAFCDKFGEEPWERLVWGSSIYQNETVFYKQKTYKRDGYVSIAIEVTLPQMQRLRGFCRFHSLRATPFSVPGMYLAYLPVQLLNTEATFCSKFVAMALQYAEVPALNGINPALTTPSMLHRLLERQAILQVVPSRMLAFMNTQRGGATWAEAATRRCDGAK